LPKPNISSHRAHDVIYL